MGAPNIVIRLCVSGTEAFAPDEVIGCVHDAISTDVTSRERSERNAARTMQAGPPGGARAHAYLISLSVSAAKKPGQQLLVDTEGFPS
jgi:hypothetical protein